MSATPVVLLTVNVHGLGPEAAGRPVDTLYGRDAHGRYTYEGGLARMLDMLRHEEVPATFFWPVFEAERCGSLLERCLREGHEVAAHGNAFEDLSTLGEREAEVLSQAQERLLQLTGQRAEGFRSTSAFSAQTLGLLADLGYRYDSSAIDDDAPYQLNETGMVELPWSEGFTDATHFSRRVTQDRAYAHLHEQGLALLAADNYACLTLHPRADIGVGRSARLDMVERLLDALRKQDAVFQTCRDVARSFSGGWDAEQKSGSETVRRPA